MAFIRFMIHDSLSSPLSVCVYVCLQDRRTERKKRGVRERQTEGEGEGKGLVDDRLE